MIINKNLSLKWFLVSLSGKLKDYGQLVKMRLTLMVVFSAIIAFLLAAHGQFEWNAIVLLFMGSFFTVGAANGINQIIEKDSDKLMKRTENRPIVQKRMGVTEAIIASSVMGFLGVLILGLFLNQFSAILAFVGLIIYAFLYTPLKKVSPIAVFVGAIAGAVPPMVGFVAFSNAITDTALVLFTIQFIWQFPHFWAIAWVLDDDYKRAGIKLLPSGGEKNKVGAFSVILFTLPLIPLSLLPVYFGMLSVTAAMVCLVVSALFVWQSIQLYRKLSNKAALQLMFGSFFYLPIVFLTFLIDKII